MAGALVGAGCAATPAPVVYERSVDVPVDGGDYLFEVAIDPPSLAHIDFSQERELLGRGIALQDIARVTVEELSVHTRESDETLDWFQSARLRMRAPSLGTHTVAEIEEFPEDESEVYWDGEDDTDVTGLVTSGSTTIWLDLRGDAPPDDTQIRVDFALMVVTH